MRWEVGVPHLLLNNNEYKGVTNMRWKVSAPHLSLNNNELNCVTN